MCYNRSNKMSKIARVCELLDQQYGRPEWGGRKNVLDELILTILSQNTTAVNARRAFACLRSRFATWEDVRLASVDKIAEAIKVGGLANRKAPRIKKILEEIHARQGTLDLEWLAEKSDSEAIDYLRAFEGVGRKTAACTLMFALGRTILPVDTHVHRVAERLGLISKVNLDTAHHLLQTMVTPDRVYSFHINMIRHGRAICRAKSPKCAMCLLKNDCDYYAGLS